MEIYSLIGQKVYEAQVSQRSTISLANFDEDVYVVKMTESNHITRTEKIILK